MPSTFHNVAVYDMYGCAGETSPVLADADASVSSRLVLTDARPVLSSWDNLPLEELSRFELRERLYVKGWLPADVDNPFGVVPKRLRRHGTAAYFRCLLEEHIGLVPGLSHSAQDGYYRCHSAMLNMRHLVLSHIPVSRLAPWFEELELFFEGCGVDPRLESIVAVPAARPPGLPGAIAQQPRPAFVSRVSTSFGLAPCYPALIAGAAGAETASASASAAFVGVAAAASA